MYRWITYIARFDFIPVHVEYAQDRVGDLIMLTVGESLVRGKSTPAPSHNILSAL